jgi:hypothetical protein
MKISSAADWEQDPARTTLLRGTANVGVVATGRHHDKEVHVMKVTALVLAAVIAAAIGYLLGTESGRQQKETILAKFGRGADGEIDLESITDVIEEKVPV